MTNILFSCIFDPLKVSPNRLRFVQELQDACGKDWNFYILNRGGILNADLPVVNVAELRSSESEAPEDEMIELLAEHVPDDARLLLKQMVGELNKVPTRYNNRVEHSLKLVRAFLDYLERVDFDVIFLWHQYNFFHRFAAAVAKKRGIKVIYFHDGVLPGSLSIDVDGEMGESWVSQPASLIRKVQVTSAEITRAKAYIQNVANETFGQRHEQKEKILVEAAIKLKKLNNRPLIFFAGQNDWHAGLKGDPSRHAIHSRLRLDTVTALEHLDRMAGKKGYTILFKPHPTGYENDLFLQNDRFPNTVILSNTDIGKCIDVADIVCTIASQTSYLALMQGKKIVMLGRNQLSNKGAAYEVGSLDALEDVFDQALKGLDVSIRERAFAKHVAQLEKAYLFSSDGDNSSFFRRGSQAAAELVKSVLANDVETVIEQNVECHL